MLNKTNVIGAVVILKQCHKMPNKIPLKVIDYNDGDAGTCYDPMILVHDKESKNSDWVMLKSVTRVVNKGLPFEDKSNIKVLLKQLGLYKVY